MDNRCDGITRDRGGRYCKRPATTHLIDRDGTCRNHYCAQHARGAGVMRMLLPRPWEYDHTERYS